MINIVLNKLFLYQLVGRCIVGIGSDYQVATTFPSYVTLDNIEVFVRCARAGVAGVRRG